MKANKDNIVMAPIHYGIWGKPTSTLDWCEENYVVTQFIAEFCKYIGYMSSQFWAGKLMGGPHKPKYEMEFGLKANEQILFSIRKRRFKDRSAKLTLFMGTEIEVASYQPNLKGNDVEFLVCGLFRPTIHRNRQVRWCVRGVSAGRDT